MDANRELIIRREDDETAILAKLVIRIERQQGIEHRQRAVLNAERGPRFARVTEHLPPTAFSTSGSFGGGQATCQVPKRRLGKRRRFVSTINR